MQDFTRIHDQKVTDMSNVITEMENREKVVQNWVHLLKVCRSNTSETRVFLEMKKVLQKEKELKEKFEKDLSTHGCLEYLFNLNTDVEKLLTGIGSIGKVDVIEKPGVSTKLQTKPCPSLKVCDPKLITSFSIKSKYGVETSVCGGRLLPDNSLLLPLYGNRTLVKFNINGDLIQKSDDLSGRVWDVTTIDSNTAVVTRPNQMAIDFVNIQTLKVNKTISVNEQCYGIASSDNRLYVGFYRKLLVLDRDGIKIHEIRTNGGYIYGVMVTNGKDRKFVYTDYSHHSCHFVRLSDFTEVHTFTHRDLRNPKGVTSDREGNVYITGQSSGNVLQVSQHGVLIRILIKGLDEPLGIHFHSDSNTFFVSYSYPASVNIYKMVNS